MKPWYKKWWGILIIFFFIAPFISYLTTDPKDYPKSEPKTEAVPAPPSEAVYNSAWDGSVYQVKDYLKQYLKDPNSIEAIEWSPVVKTKNRDRKYVVRCMYRAKNSFGGYAISNQRFWFDGDGTLVFVEDLK